MGTSYEDARLRRVRVGPETTFGIDQGTTTMVDTPAIEGTVQSAPLQQQLDPQPLQQYLDGRASEVLGIKSSTLKFSTQLASHGLSIDGTVANANLPVPSGTGQQWWMANLMSTACLGGWQVESAALAAQTKVAS